MKLKSDTILAIYCVAVLCYLSSKPFQPDRNALVLLPVLVGFAMAAYRRHILCALCIYMMIAYMAYVDLYAITHKPTDTRSEAQGIHADYYAHPAVCLETRSHDPQAQTVLLPTGPDWVTLRREYEGRGYRYVRTIGEQDTAARGDLFRNPRAGIGVMSR